MISDPNPLVTTALVWLREITVIVSILVFGWKSRGAFQGVIDFKNSIISFMDDMREFAHRVETNHMKHMEESLELISRPHREHITVTGGSDAG